MSSGYNSCWPYNVDEAVAHGSALLRAAGLDAEMAEICARAIAERAVVEVNRQNIDRIRATLEGQVH